MVEVVSSVLIEVSVGKLVSVADSLGSDTDASVAPSSSDSAGLVIAESSEAVSLDIVEIGGIGTGSNWSAKISIAFVFGALVLAFF